MVQGLVSYSGVAYRQFVSSLMLLAMIAFCSVSLAADEETDGDKQSVAPASAANPPGEKKSEEQPIEARPTTASDLGNGRLIRVTLPLLGNDDARIKSAIQRALTQLTAAPQRDGHRPTLILELVPQHRSGSHGEGTEFTRALSLADYLTQPELAGVKTVAYIPRTIKGHGVLVALACEEIVMDRDAELGDAGVDEDSQRAINPKVLSAYREVARARRTVPEAIAVGMVDRRQAVLKVETDRGIDFVAVDKLDELKKNYTVVSQDVLVPAGTLGNFSGWQGREFGFVKLLANDEKSLARGLSLPLDAVKEDQSLVGNWRPVMVRLAGPITPRSVSQLKTLIGVELRDRHVNWIGVLIDSAGDDMMASLDLANVLASLDSTEVETVAYVPMDASGGAAAVALACNQLIMHPEAHLGGKGIPNIERGALDAVRNQIKSIPGKNSERGWSLMMAMIDPGIELFTYQNGKTGEVRYLSAEERGTLPGRDNWRKGVRVKAAGESFRLSSKRAEELGIASSVVGSFDEFKKLFGFTAGLRTAEPNWALELVEALSSPALTVLLLVIGFVGIYIELHAPGTGVGAFVAALAFLLFFWSQFLHGTAGWLEVVLFLGGLFCMLLEVFVLPGFGIFGLGGGAMILVSLVLASQTFILPQTESQLADLRHSLTIVAAALVAVVVSSIALRRYLPKAPVFNRIVLEPRSEEDLIDLDYRESLVDYSSLVGQVGKAITNLMPAGKADFDGTLVDVIADGLPIDRGVEIVVTKTRGNRVLVRRVQG